MPIPSPTPPPPRAPHGAKPITVSIVSHGQLGLIRPLLEQLDRWSHASIERVVLTVNIPERDEVADLLPRLRFPVERIDNATPKGFGANQNQAFSRCATPWFLVLNPDIRLDTDVLAPLVAGAPEACGLLAPRILEPGKDAPEQHRSIITPLEILTRHRPGYARPAVPDWIPGLFMLFRSSAFEAIAGFDERFFMYGEDFDVCARLHLAGWTINVNEDLTALHEAQRTSHRRLKYLYWHALSLTKVWLSRTFWRYRKKRRFN